MALALVLLVSSSIILRKTDAPTFQERTAKEWFEERLRNGYSSLNYEQALIHFNVEFVKVFSKRMHDAQPGDLRALKTQIRKLLPSRIAVLLPPDMDSYSIQEAADESILFLASQPGREHYREQMLRILNQSRPDLQTYVVHCLVKLEAQACLSLDPEPINNYKPAWLYLNHDLLPVRLLAGLMTAFQIPTNLAVPSAVGQEARWQKAVPVLLEAATNRPAMIDCFSEAGADYWKRLAEDNLKRIAPEVWTNHITHFR